MAKSQYRLFAIDAGLCCENRVKDDLPPTPDGFIPRLRRLVLLFDKATHQSGLAAPLTT